MLWIAPSEQDTAAAALEKRLRAAINHNARVKQFDSSKPGLGFSFQRVAAVTLPNTRGGGGRISIRD